MRFIVRISIFENIFGVDIKMQCGVLSSWWQLVNTDSSNDLVPSGNSKQAITWTSARS